jgi:hypothetical protein
MSTMTALTSAQTATVVPSSPALVGTIRGRRLELEAARIERAKRRQRALAREHTLQEELEGEEKQSLLLTKLMRASQEERRIAIELTHRRSEEQLIRDNRAFLEKQRAERLHRNFQEALQREAEVCARVRVLPRVPNSFLVQFVGCLFQFGYCTVFQNALVSHS